MIRAAFLSSGLFLVLCGGMLFCVDEVTLSKRVTGSPSRLVSLIATPAGLDRLKVTPPEWMPFTFVGVGGVTMLYAVALPRK